MYNEILILDRLQHINVLPFLGVCLPDSALEAEKNHSQGLPVKPVFSPAYGIVTPWLENGNILQYLRRYPSSNRTAKVKFWPLSLLLAHI